MKIRGAVLNAMGATAPYAQVEAARDRGGRARRPGPGRGAGEDRRRGPLPFRSLGDQRRPAAADADGARPRGRGHRRGDSAPASTTSSGATTSCWCSCRAAATALPCAEGRPALCEPGAAANTAGTLLSGGARGFTRNGQPINHHLGCSAFAEYATVSRRSLVKIDPELPLDEAALFGCAVLTGVGAVVNTAKARDGADRGGHRPGRRRACRRCSARWPRARAASSRSTSPTTSSQLAKSSARPTPSTPAIRIDRRRGEGRDRAAASTTRSSSPARSRRWSSPTRSRAAAARR